MTKEKYTTCPYCGGRYQYTEDQSAGRCDYCREWVEKGKWKIIEEEITTNEIQIEINDLADMIYD